MTLVRFNVTDGAVLMLFVVPLYKVMHPLTRRIETFEGLAGICRVYFSVRNRLSENALWPAIDIRQKFKKEMSGNRKLRKRGAAIGENCPMSRSDPIFTIILYYEEAS